MQTVPRMTNLFKEFLLKIVLSQFQRLNLTLYEHCFVIMFRLSYDTLTSINQLLTEN